MKAILLIFISVSFVLFPVFADEVEIIELHTKKSLDQLVLENNADDESNEVIKNESVEDLSNVSGNSNEEINEVAENQVANTVNETTVNFDNFWEKIQTSELDKNLNKITFIKSDILRKEFVDFLSDINLNYQDSTNSEVFYIVVNKLYEIGEIQKAYEILQSINVEEKDKNIIFFKTLELNFLLSTYQLNKACNLKEEISINKVILPNYLLEKTDIFCLIMQEKVAEAELLNSLLLETEKIQDQYFQNLYLAMINTNNQQSITDFDLLDSYSEDLIFLYSAMLRIAELPLSEKFLEIDSNNLSIPVILSNSTDMNIRLKAANKSYLNNIISIDSLSALYQSVDFSSKQLNDPKNTLPLLAKDKEYLMAYYFQLANIQIFPSERLKVILDFWNYAKNNQLESIAYALTQNIILSIEPSIENADYGAEIATAHIYNQDFDNAQKWIIFSENANGSSEDITKAKFLLDLYNSNDISKIVDFINENIELLDKNTSEKIKEIIFVIIEVLEIEIDYDLSLDFDIILDERLMPSVFLNSLINQKIKTNDDYDLLLLMIISLNDRNWDEIHPEHLKLVLRGVKNYNNSSLLKELLIEIFKNYSIL